MGLDGSLQEALEHRYAWACYLLLLKTAASLLHQHLSVRFASIKANITSPTAIRPLDAMWDLFDTQWISI